MLLRITATAVLSAGLLGLAGGGTVAQEKKDEKKLKPEDLAKAKKALAEVQDFVGQWNLEGSQSAGGKTDRWKEKVSWGWKFKDADAWITVEFAPAKGSDKPKFFTDGELRYDLDKKKYVLTLNGADKTEQVFEGSVAPTGGLKLERKDKAGDVYRLTLNTVADGVRFQVKYQKQEGGKGVAQDVFVMNGNKEGESLGATAKKPECVVSGGAASIAVDVGGKKYFVCCSGCRDELLANPKKYIK